MLLRKYENQIIIVLAISLIFSYAIEAIISPNLDLTLPILIFTTLFVILGILITSRIKKFHVEDGILFIFIIYILLHSIFITNIISTMHIILGSLIAYYIGRIINIKDTNDFLFFRKITNIYGYILICFIVFNYFNSISQYRVTVGSTHPVAIGELLGLFVIINFLSPNGVNKHLIGRLNAFIGLATMLFIVGSRGAFFSVILCIFVILMMLASSKGKLFILVSAILSLFFYNFVTTSMYVISKFPTISRFSFKNILNDPSVTGSSQYVGRFDVYKESLQLFEGNFLFGAGLKSVYSHNIFLELLATTGLLGFLILFLFFLLIIIKSFKITNNQTAYWLVALFFFVFIYRQTSFALDTSKSVFLFAGILITLYYDRLKVRREYE
ncbi:O-antigen ligase family protein [Rossellomorea sp. NPDC071047]|uniref:O-antigen ligase family protein n=1 Tax=Rossellomorea sp. NPDC071047 TaxID=3390675 RepID=UPI003D047144